MVAMVLYADPHVCPDCRSAIEYGVPVCPQCSLTLHGPQAQALFLTLGRADELIRQLREPAPAPAPVTVPPLVLPQTPPRPSRLEAASVPRILLGLGALCLLTAGVVFLAVAWASLGMGGRTAILLTLTGGAAWATTHLAGRALRGGAESLAVVTLGLLALDLSGADNAGWLGDHGPGWFAIICGTAVSLAALTLARFGAGSAVVRLVGAEGICGLGLLVAGTGLADALPDTAAAPIALAGTLAMAALAQQLRLRHLSFGLGGLAGFWWVGLVAVGVRKALLDPTAHAIWAELHVWPLLLAAAVVAVPAFVPSLRDDARVASASVALIVLTGAATIVVAGNPLAHLAYAAVIVVAVAGAGTRVLPGAWRWAPAGPLVPAVVVTVFCTILQSGVAASRLAIEPWSLRPADHVLATELPLAGWLLPLLVATLVGAALCGVRLAGERLAPSTALPVIGIVTAALTLASYDVPVGLPFAVLLIGTLVVFGQEVLTERLHVASSVLGAAALLAALPSDWLTLAALVVLTGLALVTDLLDDEALVARALLPLLLGSTIGTFGELAAWTHDWTAVTVIAAVALLAIWRPDPLLEVVAYVTMAGAVVAQQPDLTWLAIDLTVAGVLVTASALVRSRRELGWLGGALLTGATWVRLADLDVTTVEAYTLPLAAALVLVGLYRMWRTEATSLQALTPGLTLAVTPTLLQVLAEPVSDRALLLGLGCLALVLAGVGLRWGGPLVVGATAGALEVLREASYASVLPQWVLIGVIGSLLTVIGVTWEQRLRDLRLAAGYVRSLR
jgi:hypothetical protein